MSRYCEDCGTRMSSTGCPGCQEELVILNEQSDYIDYPLSDDFTQKASDQSARLEEMKRGWRS